MKTDLQSRIEATEKGISQYYLDSDEKPRRSYEQASEIIMRNQLAIMKALNDKQYPCPSCKRWYGEGEIMGHRCVG